MNKSNNIKALYGPGEIPLVDVKRDRTFPLSVFKSFLYNQSVDRPQLSNAIVFWDLLPKYVNDGFNSATEVPPAVERYFTYSNQRFKFTQFPGTTQNYRLKNDIWITRYPGVREQYVELALMKLATEDNGVCDDDSGEVQYGVMFSIRQLRRVLERMGHEYNHYQVIEALDILTSSNFILETAGGEKGKRSHILTEYEHASEAGSSRQAPDTRWRVFFNRVVAKAIDGAQYRQFDLTRLYSRRSYGIHVVKRLIFTSNLSEANPLTVRFTELQETTSGLNYARTSDGIAYLEKEIKRLKNEGVLTHYDKEVVKSRGPSAGRPAIVDAVFSLYPSAALISEVKASNVRQMRAEQELQLSPRTRKERQMELALAEK